MFQRFKLIGVGRVSDAVQIIKENWVASKQQFIPGPTA